MRLMLSLLLLLLELGTLTHSHTYPTTSQPSSIVTHWNWFKFDSNHSINLASWRDVKKSMFSAETIINYKVLKIKGFSMAVILFKCIYYNNIVIVFTSPQSANSNTWLIDAKRAIDIYRQQKLHPSSINSEIEGTLKIVWLTKS